MNNNTANNTDNNTNSYMKTTIPIDEQVLSDDIKQALITYCLRLGDSTLILSQRYCELLGMAPTLEEELALSNVGLDYIGQATTLLDLAGDLEGKQRNADKLAFFRDERQFYNLLITEQNTANFAETMIRSFFFSAYYYPLLLNLQECPFKPLADFAKKAVKEVKYHLNHAQSWIIRLGDGTKESHKKMQDASEKFWAYSAEMFIVDNVDNVLQQAGFVPNKTQIKQQWDIIISKSFSDATLKLPNNEIYQFLGGTTGTHSEGFGQLVAQMQYLQRSYPNKAW